VKQIGLVACLASALGGCVSQAGAPAPEVQVGDVTADLVEGSAAPQPPKTAPSTALVEHEVQCAVEAKCLARLLGIASRTGKLLSLKLENGQTKLFRNTDKCELVGDSCTIMELVEYRPSQHVFVLSVQYYESSGSTIVSRRSGQVFRIVDAKPHFSPDGKRFAVVAFDNQDGINEVSIFSTRAFPPLLEWRYTPKSFSIGFDFVGWDGNDRVKLSTLDHSEAEVSRTSTGWRLTPADG
jgi:hypothetical protein